MSDELKEFEVVEAPIEEGGQKAPKKKKEKSKAQKIIEWVLFGIFMVIFGIAAAGVIDGKIHQKDNCNQELRFGYGSFLVLTNSMEPKYKVGTALITYKEDVNKLSEQLKGIGSATIYKDTTDELVYSFEEADGMDMTFMNIRTSVDWVTFDFAHNEYRYDPFQPDKLVIKNQIMTHRIRELHVFKNVELGQGKYVFVTSGINHGGEAALEGQFQFVTEKEYLGIVKMNSDFIGKVFKFMSSIWGLFILLLVPAFYLIITSAIDIFKTLKENEATEENGEANNTPSDLDTLSAKDRERLKQELLDEMIANKKGEKKDDEGE